MLQQFVPTWQVSSIYDLPVSELTRHNITTVLTDFDNTLIAWNQPDGSKKLEQWLQQMHAANILVVVVSNNNHRRLQQALAPYRLPFIARALKPLGVGLNKALRQYNLDKDHTVMVGDQLLTDVWAANKVGLRSILVRPLVESDAKVTKFNRWLEKRIFTRLQHRKLVSSRWEQSLND